MSHRITICTLLVMMGCCVGCTRDNATPTDRSGKPVVVCTTTMIADLARNLAAERFDVIGLMRVGEDPHIYNPRPLDALTIQKAKVLLSNGLHLEGTLAKIINNNLAKDAILVALADDPRIKSVALHNFQGAPDPHCWFDVSYFRICAERCRDALLAADPTGKDVLQQAAAAYLGELDKLHAEVKEKIAQIPKERRILITSHDAFQYFGRAYDIEVHAVIGISTEQQPRPLDVENLIKLVAEKGIKAVFIETSVSATLNALVRRVSEKTGAKLGGTLYSDSLGDDASPGKTYLGMIRYNVDTIVKGLK